jgi:hypothetical protein
MGIDYSYIGRLYLACNTPSAVEKGITYCNAYVDQLIEEIVYYRKFNGNKTEIVARELDRCLYAMRQINQICNYYSQNLDQKYKEELNIVIQKIAMYINM